MKTILSILLAISASSANAETQSIGRMEDREVAIFATQRNLICTRIDQDQDGEAEASRVTLITGNQGINGNRVGFLRAGPVVQIFDDLEGKVCEKVERIIGQSGFNFSSSLVIVNSELFIDQSVFREVITLKVTNHPLWPNMKMESIILNDEVEVPRFQISLEK